MAENPTVLVIDDETGSRESMAIALEKAGYRVRTFDDARNALTYLDEDPNRARLAVCDLKMPGVDGLGFLAAVREAGHPLRVILVTAFGSIDSAVEAMRVGADDYLTKPVDLYELRARVANLMEKEELREEVGHLRRELDKRYGFESIIGSSPEMERLFERMRMVAPTGLLVGTAAGYLGGWIDTVLMRVTDVFLAFPRLILALAFVSALGPGIENAVIAIACTAWPPYARVARAETLTIRGSDFIAAIRLQGAGPVRIVLGHVHALCRGRHVDGDLAQRDLRGGGEFVPVAVVVGLHLGVGDLQLLHDLALLHLLDEHGPLQLPAQIGHRHAFLLQRRLQGLVGFDLVFLLDVLDDAVELFGAHGEPELPAALHHQQLVHGIDDHGGRDFRQRALQGGIAVGAEVGVALAQGRDLARLEIGLGDDLAVHLHEHLLDDLPERPRHRHRDR